MDVISKEGRIRSYIDIALDKGAYEVVEIGTTDILREPRTYLVCMRCTHGGWVCPPNILKPWEFYAILDRYILHLLIHAPSDRVSHESALAVEKQAQKDGFYFAYALGSCHYLCNYHCKYLDGEECPYPEMARPSMQSLGIDVVKTVHALGLPLEIGTQKDWYSLVMLE